MVFKGVATALITPFTNDKIDLKSYKKLLKYQLDGGVDAVVALGTTGEPSTMSQEEKELVISAAVKELKGRIPVIVGAGANSTAAAIENCKLAEKLGADALLVVTPYYNKCTQGGLIAHYSAIAESVSLPIICYNVPARTGVNMLPETFAKLAEIKNISAIKEASGSMEQISECVRLCEGKADVYSGDDALILPTLAIGGKGVISVASNVCPKYVSELVRTYFSGEIEKAARLQRDMLPLIKALFLEVNPIPVKYAASLLGLCDGTLRLPLTQIGRENGERVKKILSDFC